MACGTPVATYNTGGSIECINNNGFIFEQGDYSNIIDVLDKLPKVVVKKNKYSMIDRYIDLYKEMISNEKK